MVKHYREGKEESLGFEGVRVKSISERHHQKPESLVNCNKSKMSVKIGVGDGGGRERSKSLFKRVHTVKSPGKKKVTTTSTAKYSDIQANYNSNTSESSNSSYSDEEPPPQKRPKQSQQRQPNGFTKNVNKKKTDSKRKPVKPSKKEEEEEFVVESIMDTKKDKDGTRFFFVKWENYDSTENTWEPIENLEKCRDMIKEFLEMRKNNNNNVQKKKVIINYITTDEDDDDDDDQDESTDEDEEEDESDHRDENDDKHNKLSVKEPEKPINGIVSQNGITFPDVSSIKASMISSAQKVVDGEESDVDLLSRATTPSCSELSDEYYSDEGKSLQKISNLGTYIKIPHTGNLFYIRIIDEGNGQLNWAYVDVNEPQPEKEIFYRCVVTEDLTGKEPKFIFGATTSVDGEKFCLVQFEGHSYVEVIPPENLFSRFPSLRKFFEVHCPNLFQKNTH